VWSALSAVGARDGFDIVAAMWMTAEVEAAVEVAVSRGTEILMQDIEAA